MVKIGFYLFFWRRESERRFVSFCFVRKSSFRIANLLNVSLFSSRKKTAELRTAYTHDKAHVETNVAFDNTGPILNGAVVLGHQGWLVGYQYVFNTARSVLTKNNFAVGFRAKDFTLYANM